MMKTAENKKVTFKLAAILLAIVLLAGVYGYRFAQTPDKPVAKEQKATPATAKQAKAKMAPGAACCKSSFSRAKILSGATAHSKVTPAKK